MSTSILYNGVQLINVKTRRFYEEPVRDDSGTDTLFHRFIIRAAGVVHNIAYGATVDVIPPGGKNVSTVLNQVSIRQALLEDRKPFEMTIDGTTILQANTTLNHVDFDVDNGPKPKMCEVVHIAGSSVFRVEWEIEIAKIDCAGLSETADVLNNRWSLKDDIDQDWYTTRTMSGRLRLSSAQLNPHSFRKLCIPGLQPNFKRESISVVSSPDGLTLEYTVTDRQVYAAAPAPATTWTGTLTGLTDDGVITKREFQISVSAPPNVPKTALIDLCAKIALVKLDLGNPGNVLLDAAIVDHLEANAVDFRVTIMGDPGVEPYDSNSGASFPLPIGQLGIPLQASDFPNYDPGTSEAPPLYGQATPAGLLICFLQSPCDNDSSHVVKAGDSSGNEGTESIAASGSPTVDYQIQPLAEDAQIQANYSASHSEALYTHYRIASTYGAPQGIVQVPYSQPNGNEQTSAFIQVCAPSSWRVVRVEAERVGKEPEFPPAVGGVVSGVNGQINMVVLDFKVTPEAPSLTADGQKKRYRATAEYTYAFDKPFTPQDTLDAGSLPWMASSLQADAFTGELSAGIL